MPLGAADTASVAVRMRSEVNEESAENLYFTGFDATLRTHDYPARDRSRCSMPTGILQPAKCHHPGVGGAQSIVSHAEEVALQSCVPEADC